MCTINWLSAFIILLVSGFIIEMPDPSSNLSYLSIAFLVLSVIQSVFIFTQLFDTTGLNNKEIEQIIITGRASGNLKMSTTLIQTY